MPSAGLEPHRAVSWAVAAGLALLGWVGAAGLFSSAPLFGLWLLTHLRVHGECASAQSLQAVGLNIICLWFSGPDTHPAMEGWVRVRGCVKPEWLARNTGCPSLSWQEEVAKPGLAAERCQLQLHQPSSPSKSLGRA